MSVHGHVEWVERETKVLGLLDAERLEKVLEWLEPEDVVSLGQTCFALNVACLEEPVWMNFCLKRFGGNLERLESWRSTFMSRCPSLRFNLSSCLSRNKTFHSEFLKTRWFRCNAILENFIPDDPLVERVSACSSRLTQENFFLEFDAPRKPVMIVGATERWPCRSGHDRHDWSIEGLAKRFQDTVHWDVSHGLDEIPSKMQMTMKDYETYVARQKDETPLYIFDGKFGEKAPELLGEYDSTVGGIFREDFLSVLEQRPPFRWIVVGPGRTGAPWHKDPSCTSAWNALIHGHKRWALYPPEVTPPGVQAVFGGPEDTELLDSNTPNSLTWYLTVYPTLTKEQRPIEVVQGPGDVLFIPAGWWHMVLNLDTTVSVTQNFVSRANLRAAVNDLFQDNGPAFMEEFQLGMRLEHPEIWETLHPLVSMYENGFENDYEFLQSFKDVAMWERKLEHLLKHHGVSLAAPFSFAPLGNRLNPVFEEVNSGFVVKLFSHFCGPEVGFGSSAIEPGVVSNGLVGCRLEAKMLSTLGAFSGELLMNKVPELFAWGVYYGPGCGEAWSWPYTIMTKVEGVSLGSVRKMAEWNTPATRWLLRKGLRQVARELGHVVKRIHGMSLIVPTLGAEIDKIRGTDFVGFLSKQRVYAVSSQWRKGTIPLHLLRQLGSFVDDWLPEAVNRCSNRENLVSLHGDLQQENVFVHVGKSAEEETRALLKELWTPQDNARGEDDAALEMLIEQLVDEHLVRKNSLLILTEQDMVELGIPFGPRKVLRKWVDDMKRSGLVQKGGRQMRLSGVIDFGDALFGDPIYDLVALFISAFELDKDLLAAFLSAYAEGSGVRLTQVPYFSNLALLYTLLHHCEALRFAFRKDPSLAACQSWDQVAHRLWSV